MAKILLPSVGAEGWKRLLAQPDLHWARGYSARTLAYAWEEAIGLPPEIASLLSAALGPVKLLLAIPEHKTALPGGKRDSQSDVFALVRSGEGLVACTIEGKVDEPFGPTLGEWLIGASAGKSLRLKSICELLGLSSCPPEIHYQLLHRTAAALLEAEHFAASSGAMIVQSFSPEHRWFEEFQRFAELFGRPPAVGDPLVFTAPSGRTLILGWACGDQAFRTR
jgi:hypothetical protein